MPRPSVSPLYIPFRTLLALPRKDLGQAGPSPVRPNYTVRPNQSRSPSHPALTGLDSFAFQTHLRLPRGFLTEELGFNHIPSKPSITLLLPHLSIYSCTSKPPKPSSPSAASWQARRSCLSSMTSIPLKLLHRQIAQILLNSSWRRPSRSPWFLPCSHQALHETGG
jgi:hypothetical protein